MGPGTYALILHLDHARTIEVGALGPVLFPAGWHLYLGSARGPGGLDARLARHRRRSGKRFHWHVDYLRAQTRLVAVWIEKGQARRECDWAQTAASLPGASLPVRGFGASDCTCAAHLFHYPTRPDPDAFERLLGTTLDRRLIYE